jgi:hypothetical protein
MFKKSNRNFRVKKQTDSESENESEKPSLTKSINKNTTVANTDTQNKIGLASQKVLSFNDADLGDNDDQESNSANEMGSSKEFRVKKSKESRRIMKELKKSKKEKEKMLKMDSSSTMSNSSKLKQENSSTADAILFNEGIKGKNSTELFVLLGCLINFFYFKKIVKPLKLKEDQNKQFKSKYVKNMYKNFEENSNDSDEFNALANETSDEDEEVSLKNINVSKCTDESEQLKVKF